MENSQLLEALKILIRTHRLKSGHTCKSLAELSGMNEKTIKKYESDCDFDVPITKIFYILKLLKVPVSEIQNIIQLNY
jgi:DNA-binding XRE family transcriptional regulator